MKANEKTKVLECGNQLAKIVESINECHDIWLSDLAKLETLVSNIRELVKARPQIDPERDNCSKPWEDYVLPDDPRAFYWRNDNE